VSWSGVVAVCVAIGALGAAADQLLKSRLKRNVYDYFLSLWSRLEDSTIADLPSVVASFAVTKLRLARASQNKTVAVAKVLLVSFVLTAVSALVGRLVRRYTFSWYESNVLAQSVGFFEATEIHTRWLYDKSWHYCPALLVNLVFDVGTVVTTLGCLRAIGTRKSALLRYGIILANLGVALVLAIGSLAVAHWVVDRDRPFLRVIRWSAECIFAVLTWDTSRKFASGFDDAFVGLSTLIPLSLYLFMLAGAILARALLLTLRGASLYWLELATEPLPKDIDSRFKPFTLLGLVFGSFGIIAKLCAELAKR
jgi:hypothetical protein